MNHRRFLVGEASEIVSYKLRSKVFYSREPVGLDGIDQYLPKAKYAKWLMPLVLLRT
jgi:hypothetical protein